MSVTWKESGSETKVTEHKNKDKMADLVDLEEGRLSSLFPIHEVFEKGIVFLGSLHFDYTADPKGDWECASAVANPGFPRGGGTNPRGVANLLFGQFFPKTA